MNRADRMYAALRDGRPKSRREIHEHAGCFFLTNNAAAELRARGLTVEQWYEGRNVVYRLVGALPETSGIVRASAVGLEPVGETPAYTEVSGSAAIPPSDAPAALPQLTLPLPGSAFRREVA